MKWDSIKDFTDSLDEIDFPESTKEVQRNWIGKSEGALIDFKVKGSEEKFTVFTTRPDTLFGATYCVLAPEHDLVKKIMSEEQSKEVLAYIDSLTCKIQVMFFQLNLANFF